MKKENVLWGFILIVLGLILGLNAVGILNVNLFFDGWWTLFIIVPSVVSLFTKKDKTGGLIGLLAGILLLLASQNVISFELVGKLFLPLLLIFVGCMLVFKNKEKIEFKKTNKKNTCAVFSGQELNYNNQEFDGANIEAIFGGIDMDLRNANIKDESVINAVCVFGGIDLLVEDDIEVKVNTTSIFGGVENKNNNTKAKKTIYVNAVCVFGGIDIKTK